MFRSTPQRVVLEDDEGGLPREYAEFCIMREMGWDYWTMVNQPDFVIDRVEAFLAAEGKASDRIKTRKHG